GAFTILASILATYLQDRSPRSCPRRRAARCDRIAINKPKTHNFCVHVTGCILALSMQNANQLQLKWMPEDSRGANPVFGGSPGASQAGRCDTRDFQMECACRTGIAVVISAGWRMVPGSALKRYFAGIIVNFTVTGLASLADTDSPLLS